MQQLRLAEVAEATEAEGPGRRFAVWVQGCRSRCAGCCNPEMQSFDGGGAVAVDALTERIVAAAQRSSGPLADIAQRSSGPLADTAQRESIEGVTLQGGEPFDQAAALATLARAVRRHGLTVLVFTGYLLEELKSIADRAVGELLREIDVLIDGPYRRDQPETRRRWIGSTNQRIHFLTDRYQADDPRWTQPNSLEIRLVDGELTVNGFPAASGAGLWKEIGRRTATE